MRPEVAACIDEIEAAKRIIKDKSSKSKSKARSWIIKQKSLLQTLGYKGKI